MSLRDAIRDAVDLNRTAVEVPEWGQTLYVRSLTGQERESLELWMTDNKGPDEKVNNLLLLTHLLVVTTVDAEGAPVFQPGDEEWLRAKNSKALLRLFEASAGLNGLGKEDQEELVKNYANGQCAGLPTG